MENATIITIVSTLLIVLAFVLSPAIIGQRYGSKQIIKHPDLSNAPIGTIVGTAFGLLAFIMAFTFQIASSRFEARKKLLLDEVTAIRAVNLRAGFLPENNKKKAKTLLLEYVNLQSNITTDLPLLEKKIIHLNEILDTLWNDAEKLAASKDFTNVQNNYLASLSSLIDIYNQRLTVAFEYRIPIFIMIILGVIIFCAMFLLGFYFGISSKNYFRATLIYAIIFSLVIMLILILDHPELGLTNVNQQPIMLLKTQMKMQMANGL